MGAAQKEGRDLRSSEVWAVAGLPKAVQKTLGRRGGLRGGDSVCKNHLEDTGEGGWALDSAGREYECGVNNFNCPHRTSARAKKKNDLATIPAELPKSLRAKMMLPSYVKKICGKCRMTIVNAKKKRPLGEEETPAECTPKKQNAQPAPETPTHPETPRTPRTPNSRTRFHCFCV